MPSSHVLLSLFATAHIVRHPRHHHHPVSDALYSKSHSPRCMFTSRPRISAVIKNSAEWLPTPLMCSNASCTTYQSGCYCCYCCYHCTMSGSLIVCVRHLARTCRGKKKLCFRLAFEDPHGRWNERVAAARSTLECKLQMTWDILESNFKLVDPSNSHSWSMRNKEEERIVNGTYQSVLQVESDTLHYTFLKIVKVSFILSEKEWERKENPR